MSRHQYIELFIHEIILLKIILLSKELLKLFLNLISLFDKLVRAVISRLRALHNWWWRYRSHGRFRLVIKVDIELLLPGLSLSRSETVIFDHVVFGVLITFQLLSRRKLHILFDKSTLYSQLLQGCCYFLVQVYFDDVMIHLIEPGRPLIQPR